MNRSLRVMLFAVLPVLTYGQTPASPASMVYILANPEQAVQHPGPIMTTGYVVSDGSELDLFLTDDHATALDWSSSIHIVDDTE